MIVKIIQQVFKMVTKIGLLIIFLSFFIYLSVDMSFKGYYVNNIYVFILQIILESNILIAGIGVYINIYYIDTKEYNDFKFYFPFIYILLFLLSYFFFRTNTINIIDVLVVTLSQITTILLISKKLNINFCNLNYSKIIFGLLIILGICSVYSYQRVVTINNKCLNVITKEEVINCVQILRYGQAGRNIYLINESNIVNIFNINPIFKKETENYLQAKAVIKGNKIEWEVLEP